MFMVIMLALSLEAADGSKIQLVPPSIFQPLATFFEDGADQQSGHLHLEANLGKAEFADTRDVVDLMPGAILPPPLDGHSLQYQIRQGVFSAELPATRNGTNDLPYAFVLQLPGTKSKKSYQLFAQGTIPRRNPAPQNNGLGWGFVIGVGAVTLALAAATLTVGLPVLGTAAKAPQPPSPAPAEPDVRFESEALTVSRTVALELSRLRSDTNRKLAALEQTVHSMAGQPTDDWRTEIGEIGTLETLAAAPSPVLTAGRDTLTREESDVAAIVNQWIASGGSTRTQMLDIAVRIELEVKLMQHVNVNRLLSDVTALNHVDLADSMTDGGWLCCRTADDVLIAAPADSRLFQSSQDRALLARMFEGMDEAAGALVFMQIVRPCRLRQRPDSDRYEIARRGVLQLAGRMGPHVALSPAYPALGATSRSMSRPVTMVAILKGQFEIVATRIARVEELIGSMIPREDVGIAASRINGLKETIVTVVQAECSELEQRLERRLVQPIAATAPAPVLPMPGRTAMKRLNEELGSVKTTIRQLAERVDEIESGAVARVLPVTPATSVEAPLASQKPAVLPPEWREAMDALEPFEGLSELELARGLQALAAALQTLPRAGEIRVAHLMEAMGRFRLHWADRTVAQEIVCGVCGGGRTFQSAVCGGAEGGAELLILLPPGDYAPYNYPAGYRQLIHNLPSQQFHIQAVTRPALLTQIAGCPMEYEVTYKLQWK